MRTKAPQGNVPSRDFRDDVPKLPPIALLCFSSDTYDNYASGVPLRRAAGAFRQAI